PRDLAGTARPRGEPQPLRPRRLRDGRRALAHRDARGPAPRPTALRRGGPRRGRLPRHGALSGLAPALLVVPHPRRARDPGDDRPADRFVAVELVARPLWSS